MIIVSFTSYPKRIGNIKIVLDSLRRQSCLPDKVVLYLAKNQFEGAVMNLDFLELQDKWFEVHWCKDNLLSHKKYYYAFQEFPNDLVITIDDDFYYSSDMVSELVSAHAMFPNCVIARRAAMMAWAEDEAVYGYNGWPDVSIKHLLEPRYDIFATTGGGTLFPPHIFGEEIFRKDVFMNKCMYADDIWIKIMQIIYNIPTVCVRRFFTEKSIREDDYDGLFFNHNRDGGNDRQLADLLDFYHVDLKKTCFQKDSLRVYDLEKERENDLAEIISFMIEGIDPKRRIAIYGAGKEGHRYYKACINKSIDKRIEAFVVTEKNNNESYVFDKKVLGFDECKKNNFVYLISTAGKQQDEIKSFLISNGVSNEDILSIYSL